MKAEELRIGNLVQDDYGQIKVVNSIDFNPDRLDYTISFPFGDYEEVGLLTPIPLTEEWFINFGLHQGTWGYYHKNGFVISVERQVYFGEEEVWIAELNYVHQLQNLYFTLTGEEL
jgi:hypothetical protein